MSSIIGIPGPVSMEIKTVYNWFLLPCSWLMLTRRKAYNRALPLRVDIRSWCSTSANDKWRSTVSGKTRYRKLFSWCALKQFNRAIFGPLKSQRNVDPSDASCCFPLHDDASQLRWCCLLAPMLELIFLFCPIFCLNLLILRMQVEKKSQGDRVKLGREAIFVEPCLQKHLLIELNEAICVLCYSRCLNRVCMHKTRVHFNRDSRWGARHPFILVHSSSGWEFHRWRRSNKILSKETMSIRRLVLLWNYRVHALTIFQCVASEFASINVQSSHAFERTFFHNNSVLDSDKSWV